METASGIYLDVLNPEASMISLDDIAHHLAQINRYTGAARRPMSVAEHALLVADRLATQGHDAAIVLHGLHYDDAEAYAGDVGRPLKLALGDTYRLIEDRLQALIEDVLGLSDVDDVGRSAVREADDWALSAEAWHLLPSRGEGWFVWGLYDPDDTGQRVTARRLREDGLPWDAAKALWLMAHRNFAALARTVRSSA